MKLFLTSFQAVAVLLGIGLLGFFIIRRRIVPKEILKVLSPLIIDIALPCLVFTEILTRFEPKAMPEWWTLPLWWAGFTLFSGLLSFLFSFLTPNFRRETALSLLYPNAIFTPLVIIPGIFGPASPLVVELYILTIFFPLFLFNTYKPLFGRKTSGGRARPHFDWLALANPILIATLVAVALKLTGASAWVPDFVLSVTRPVGAISFPLIMILIGGNISMDFEKRGRLYVREVLLFVLAKNILFPALTLVLLALVRPAFPVAFLIFLQSALPPVTTAPLLTGRVGGNESLANQYLVASFFASLATIPLALWGFGMVFPF